MKKVLLFMLMCVLSLHAYSQSKDYYYQHGGLLYHLSFYTDKENDYVADAFCLNMFYKFGYKGKDSIGQLRFQSFTYVAEQKMVQTFYSPLPIPQMTGRVIKSYTSNVMLISSDYSTMILNGMGYVRISKEKYQKIVNGVSSGSYNSTSSYSTQNNSSSKYDTENRSSYKSEWKTCTDCGGTGDCKVCHGYGKSIYDAYYTGNGKFVSECWYCGGRKDCPTCHRRKRIRIR